LYCEECGFHTTVPRRPSRQREKGHLKTEFCPKCNKETRFKEVREKDFTIENVLV
jgi:ribosomal protein L33